MSKKTTVDSFSSSVETLKVISNDKTKNVELAGQGFSAFYYHESILSDTITTFNMSKLETLWMEKILLRVCHWLALKR